MVTEAEFAALLKEDFQIYDVMHTNEKYKHLRIVFDIDKKGKDVTDPLNDSIAVITEKFPDAILNISGSVVETDDGCTKYSYHIVLFDYVVEDVNEYELVQKLCIKHKAELGFDPVIYKVNGQYKCVNQSKQDGRIQKIISGSNDPLDHSLRCNIPTDPKTMADSTLKDEDFPEPEPVEKRKRGRPKKVKIDENKDKKKAGRPKKIEVNDQGEPVKKRLNL